jgi:hypothetical protein
MDDATKMIIPEISDICNKFGIRVKSFTAQQTILDTWDINFDIQMKCPCYMPGHRVESCIIPTFRDSIKQKLEAYFKIKDHSSSEQLDENIFVLLTDTYWYDLTHSNLTIHTKRKDV